MYTLLPWLWHLLGAEPAGRKSGIVWSPSVFSRRFRGSCRNPDEVHGTLTARRQFPIRFSVGTDPDKKTSTLPRDRPTGKDTVNLPTSEEWILGRIFFDLLLSSAVRSRYFVARGLAVRAL